MDSTIYEQLIGHDTKGQQPETPKGYVPVLVGKKGESVERIHVNVKHFNDPRIIFLLEIAKEELGDRRDGILRITCDADHFRKTIDFISKGR